MKLQVCLVISPRARAVSKRPPSDPECSAVICLLVVVCMGADDTSALQLIIWPRRNPNIKRMPVTSSTHAGVSKRGGPGRMAFCGQKVLGASGGLRMNCLQKLPHMKPISNHRSSAIHLLSLPQHHPPVGLLTTW